MTSTTVNRHQFTEEELRKGGMVTGQRRRQAAAERAWALFVALMAATEEIDRQATRAAAKYDRLAGA